MRARLRIPQNRKPPSHHALLEQTCDIDPVFRTHKSELFAFKDLRNAIAMIAYSDAGKRPSTANSPAYLCPYARATRFLGRACFRRVALRSLFEASHLLERPRMDGQHAPKGGRLPDETPRPTSGLIALEPKRAVTLACRYGLMAESRWRSSKNREDLRAGLGDKRGVGRGTRSDRRRARGSVMDSVMDSGR